MWKLALETLYHVIREKLEGFKGPAKTENRQICKPNTYFYQSFDVYVTNHWMSI